jgi:hypothetical protein
VVLSGNDVVGVGMVSGKTALDSNRYAIWVVGLPVKSALLVTITTARRLVVQRISSDTG